MNSINHTVFIDNSIKQKLKAFSICESRDFFCCNCKVTCHFYIDKGEEKPKKILKILFHYLPKIVELVGKGNVKIKNLTINIFDYKGKKTLPAKGEVLSKKHINSGVHILHDFNGLNPTHEIIVYRREEMMKVIIHELIHAFNDIVTYTYSINGKQIPINEAIVEAYACFIHSILYSIHFKKNLNDVLNDELRFQQIQSTIVLHNFGLSNSHNILQYHVIKHFFFANRDRFIKCIDKNNRINSESISKIFPMIDNSFLIKNLDLIKKHKNQTLKMTFHSFFLSK